jgi:hypothetical protein
VDWQNYNLVISNVPLEQPLQIKLELSHVGKIIEIFKNMKVLITNEPEIINTNVESIFVELDNMNSTELEINHVLNDVDFEKEDLHKDPNVNVNVNLKKFLKRRRLVKIPSW